MDLITDATAAAGDPGVPTLTGTRGYFTGGTPGITAATRVRYWFLNMIMKELVGIVTAMGITPAPATATQVLQGIKRIAGGNMIAVTTGSTTLTADQIGTVYIDASGGNVSITLPAAAVLVGAVPGGLSANLAFFRFIRVDATANTVTITPAGADTLLVKAGSLSSLSVPVVCTVEMAADNSSRWLTTVLPSDIPISVASPPASDLPLAIDQRAVVTFSAVSSIPLHIATVPGLYRVTSAIVTDNTSNADLQWQPNNTTYAGAFSSWGLESGDVEPTAFGTATTAVTTTTKTISPYIGSLPFTYASTGINNFFFDQFFGPGGGDSVNDRGPALAEYVVSTATAAKMIKASSGIAGGVSSGFSRWTDTTTAWTSLGTISDGGTNLAGTIVVERLA